MSLRGFCGLYGVLQWFNVTSALLFRKCLSAALPPESSERRTFFTHISGRNFLPELCGEVHSETAPPSFAMCPSLHRTENFSTGSNEQKGAEKSGGRGMPSKRAKRKQGRVKTGQENEDILKESCVKFVVSDKKQCCRSLVGDRIFVSAILHNVICHDF